MWKAGTRRNLLAWVGRAIAAAGVASRSSLAWAGEPSPPERPEGEDYYRKLGVTPFINAAGTYTILSASVMPAPVIAAMDRAALQPVHLLELHKAAGAYLAKRLRSEAALVTAGAASAMTLATAACVTRGRPQAVYNIPSDMAELPNEVIVQRAHRYGYDHAIRDCGVRLVEVITPEQYDQSFNTRTAMAHYLNTAEGGLIGREEWVRIAHKHGVPASIDAAADVPPVSRLWDYTQMGFDLVQFSGGKGIRGPQGTGLLLGKKELIDAAMLNNNPFDDTIGRGMKVSKEQIVGLVAAVDWFLSQDEPAMNADFQRRADLIAREVSRIASVEVKIVVPEIANHVPHLLIHYDPERVRTTPIQVVEELRRGKPRIELNPASGRATKFANIAMDPAATLVVGVWMLEPGEDRIVARRLVEVLGAAVRS